MSDLIRRNEALSLIESMMETYWDRKQILSIVRNGIEKLPSAQTEIIRCKDCKYWRQQTNYAGIRLSFGFCESDNMWRSLYGETVEVDHIDTDDDFYCGYAERRTDE